MSNATNGFGASITRDGNTIAELTSIGGVSIKRDMIDVTTHQSPSGYEEVLPGIIRTGNVPLEGNFYPGDASGQIGLQSDLDAGTLQSFVTSLPGSTGTTLIFTAYVEEFSVGKADVNGIIPFSASLKISGKPTLGITLSNAITAMTLSGSGTINPVWAAAVYDYVYPVLTGVASITLTPTFAAGVCTITCGTQVQTVATTVASSAITLDGAASITTITVNIKETGKAARNYTIKVSRA
jgi:hypothetical protein